MTGSRVIHEIMLGVPGYQVSISRLVTNMPVTSFLTRVAIYSPEHLPETSQSEHHQQAEHKTPIKESFLPSAHQQGGKQPPETEELRTPQRVL